MLNTDFFKLEKNDLLKFRINIDEYKSIILEFIQKSPVIKVKEFIDWEEKISKNIDLLLIKYSFLSLNYQENEILNIYNSMLSYKNEVLSELNYNLDYYLLIKKLITEDKEDEIYKIKKIKSFEKSGLTLKEEYQEELIKINKELNESVINFMNNITNARRTWCFEINKDIYETLNQNEKMFFNNFKMDFNINRINKLLQTCENEELRKKLFEKNNEIGNKNTKYSNLEIIDNITKLKHKKASILGYQSVASMNMENSMSKEPIEAFNFLSNLSESLYPLVIKENEGLENFVKIHFNKPNIDKHSYLFYSNKMKEYLFDYTKNEERKYLNIEKSLDATFKLIKEMFDISFEEMTENISLPFQNVKFYKIYNSGNYKGIVLLDLFEREMKKSGAWVSNYIPPTKSKSGFLSLNTNFDIKEKGLSFEDLTTLLHEFGHLIHGISSETKYRYCSGTREVPRDAVEIPSQMLEKFSKEDFFLKNISEQKIPSELIEKVKKIENFRKANFYIRQIGLSLYDLDIYSDKKSLVYESYKKNMDKVKYKQVEEDSNFPMIFSHIFSGAYSAGYYGYVWSDVYSVEMFNHIKSDRASQGKLFKEKVLAYGGSMDAKDLYLNFRKEEVNLSTFKKYYNLEEDNLIPQRKRKRKMK